MYRPLPLFFLLGAPLLLMAASCETTATDTETGDAGVIDPGPDDGAVGQVVTPTDDATGVVIDPNTNG